MTPLLEHPLATVMQGEAFAALQAMPDGLADAFVTDPPYSSGGMYRGDRTADPVAKYLQSGYAGARMTTFAGDNRDQRGYLAWCTLWMGEALRVAKPGAALVVFTDWRQLPITTDAVQAAGWTWRGIVPWHKPVNRPQKGRFSAACEFAVWATAGHRPTDYPAPTLQGFMSASAPQIKDRDHPTEKPHSVLRHLVQIAPRGGLVVDLFAGSGSTGVAALAEERRVLLVELTDHYTAVAADRLRAALQPEGAPDAAPQ